MAFEDRLRSALEDAVKFCNSGSTPDEAVCKSASAAGFNRDQTDRLVETLNTAITINQYKQASDRTKSFPIAHKDKVASMMMDADKVLGTAEKKAEASHVYFEYMQPAYDYVKHADDVVIKEAEKEEKTTGLSLDNLAYLSIQQMKLVKNAADYAAKVAGVIKGNLVTKLYELADGVKKGGVEKYARFKISTKHPEVVKELEKVIPAEYKKASCNDDFVDDSDLGSFEKLAEEMASDIVSMKEMRDQSASMSKQAADMEAQINDTFVERKEEGPSTFFGLFKQSDAKDDKIRELQELLKKQHKLLSRQSDDILELTRKKREEAPSLFRTAFGKPNVSSFFKPETGAVSVPWQAVEDLAFKDYTKENDEIARTKENLKRSLMLQDLMTTDEIISSADPEAVASTYQSLLDTSPGVANNKEVVRSILRQAVNSIAISPYDAATWADLEKKQRESISLRNNSKKKQKKDDNSK